MTDDSLGVAPPSVSRPSFVTLCNVDGDTHLDLAIASFSPELVVLKGVCRCPADLDGDGNVGITDFLLLLEAWGPCPDCGADLDADDEVGIIDFLDLLASWGPCPQELQGTARSYREQLGHTGNSRVGPRS